MAGSCDARRSCVVATPDLGRVLRLDGTTWSEVDVGDLDLGAGPYLSDLSCPTKTFCALSGIRNRTTGTPNAFLAVLRDGTWERTDLSTGQVGAVDCWAASRCVATAKQDSNLTWRLLAIGRNGWRDVERPPGAMEPSDVAAPWRGSASSAARSSTATSDVSSPACTSTADARRRAQPSTVSPRRWNQ